MTVRTHDRGFVAASPALVYGRVSDPSTYPSWWPGADGGRPSLGPETVAEVSPERHREGTGLFLRLDPVGELEWYLEPWEDGTIVNCLLELRSVPRRRWSDRGLGRVRGTIRRALIGLKDDLG
jgi:hypothetical protein